jgi:hypothetical protein
MAKNDIAPFLPNPIGVGFKLLGVDPVQTTLQAAGVDPEDEIAFGYTAEDVVKGLIAGKNILTGGPLAFLTIMGLGNKALGSILKSYEEIQKDNRRHGF